MPDITTSDAYTVVDLAKTTHNHEVIAIAEILAEKTPVIRTALAVEANSLTSHVYVTRATEPGGTFTKFNQGIPVEGSQVDQMEENMCMCESLAVMDQRILDKSPSPFKTRAAYDRAFAAGLGKTFEDTFVYGNASTYPTQFDGLATRMPAHGTGIENVIDEGGSGSDCTSIYVIEWGPDTAYLIYPTGSPSVGIQTEDLGRSLMPDGQTTERYFPAWTTHFKFEVGLVVVDPKAIQRIANIETDAVSAATHGFDRKNLVRAINKLPGRGKAVIYCNQDIKTQIDIDLMDKSNTYFTMGQNYGEEVVTFRSVPIYRLDAIIDEDAF